jgi:hypothetical protein
MGKRGHTDVPRICVSCPRTDVDQEEQKKRDGSLAVAGTEAVRGTHWRTTHEAAEGFLGTEKALTMEKSEGSWGLVRFLPSFARLARRV